MTAAPDPEPCVPGSRDGSIEDVEPGAGRQRGDRASPWCRSPVASSDTDITDQRLDDISRLDAGRPAGSGRRSVGLGTGVAGRVVAVGAGSVGRPGLWATRWPRRGRGYSWSCGVQRSGRFGWGTRRVARRDCTRTWCQAGLDGAWAGGAGRDRDTGCDRQRASQRWRSEPGTMLASRLVGAALRRARGANVSRHRRPPGREYRDASHRGPEAWVRPVPQAQGAAYRGGAGPRWGPALLQDRPGAPQRRRLDRFAVAGSEDWPCWRDGLDPDEARRSAAATELG